MSVEIITIGNELLQGLGTDTNGPWIAERLATIGLEVHFKTTVGDDTGRMAEAFRAAAHRASIVIATGGLGPTPDDLTRKTIATVFRRRLVLDEVVLDKIRARFRQRGIEMPAINEAQALIPRGAKVIENPRGTAPGLHFTHLESNYFCLPGVPSETQAMLDHYVLPFLKARSIAPPIDRRIIRTVGIAESMLAEKLQALEGEETGIRFGYLPHSNGLDIVLSPATAEVAWTREALDRTERRVREIAGRHAFGSDRDTLSSVLGAALVERKLTIATAESFTGGAVGATITETAGASRYLLGGVVAYSNRAKQEILGVRATTMERHGAVSAEVAEEMAKGARDRFDSDLALSSTGIAGPDGGTPEKPVGLVYLGLAMRDGVWTERFVLGGTRGEIVDRSVSYALDLARRHLALSPV